LGWSLTRLVTGLRFVIEASRGSVCGEGARRSRWDWPECRSGSDGVVSGV